MASEVRRERKLLEELLELRAQVYAEAQNLYGKWTAHIQRPVFEYSAFNLACYLALRRRDLRNLQQDLVPLGLSSLGRCEAHVLASLDAVIAALANICRVSEEDHTGRPSLKHFTRGRSLIEKNASRLFGKPATGRHVRVMVTLAADSGQDYQCVQAILRRGADCVRINCAHDSESDWETMIRHVREAARQEGRPCPILMDLSGPRARTVEVHLAVPRQRVCKGDHILLLSEPAFDLQRTPFQAVCSIPQLFSLLRVGTTVMFNDGKIGTKVLTEGTDSVELEVFQAREKGERFRSDIGLNFPDTLVQVDPLTTKDVADLDFVCRHADLVGYSFVQEPAGMDRIVDEIRRRSAARRGKKPLGVIAKIETARAVRNLPELIVHGAGQVPFGVMIARGDLAVEIGYLRIAEIQEEILWICEDLGDASSRELCEKGRSFSS
jgi:pyruvate kinase